MGPPRPFPVDSLRKESGPSGRSFTDHLEKRARQLLQSERRDETQWSPFWMIKDSVALVLDQIDRSRKKEEEVLKELLDSECEIGTELLQMEQRTPRYSPYRFPEREKMHREMGRIRAERRRFQISQAERMEGLHERLLGLVGKWRQLEPLGSHLPDQA